MLPESVQQPIRRAIKVWQSLSKAGVRGIPKFGSHAWEIDYRSKEVVVGTRDGEECKETFVNNIVVCGYRFLEGKSLADILSNPDTPDQAKLDAIEACREVFEASRRVCNKGYFMERPDPRKFRLSTRGEVIAVSLTDPHRLVDYPSLKEVLMSFDQALPASAAHNATEGSCEQSRRE